MNWQKFYASDVIIYGIKTTINNLRVAIYSITILLCEVMASIIIVGLPTLIFALWKTPEFRILGSQIRTALASGSYNSIQSIIQNSQTIPLPLSVKIIGSIALCTLLILWSMFAAGYIRMIIKFHDTETANLRDMFMGWHRGPRLLLGMIIYTTASILGFIFLIIPGLYILVHGSLYYCFIIDKNFGPIEAFKRSFHVIHGHAWQVSAIIIFLAALSFNPITVMLVAFTQSLIHINTYRRLTA